MSLPLKIESAVAKFAAESPLAYARWNDAAFRAYVAGPLRWLVTRLAREDAPQVEAVSHAYLQMLCEGVGAGLVHPIDHGCANLLEYSLKELIPRQIAGVSKADRMKLLARIWNLAEGLSREPDWLNQYVVNRATPDVDIQTIEAFLATTLTPVLAAPSQATWVGPYRVSILNPRSWEDDFLPGEMHLMTHSIACINDRRGKTCLGILLQKEGKSELIGPLPASRRQAEPQPANFRAEPNRLCLAAGQVALPYLASPLKTLFSAGGFAIVSAVDSQRLWIVESKT